MQGETYITYTGIGGQNMDSEIMSAADISGSAHDNTENTEGKYPLSFVVSWQLPGGIQGKDAEGSGWDVPIKEKWYGIQLIFVLN